MEEKVSIESIVEERDAKMALFNGSQEPIKRKGLFLKPTSTNSYNENPTFQCNAMISKYPRYQASFRWWADPQLQWDAWVERLKPRCTNLWRKAGIFDAIMASKCRIRRDPHALLGVSRFWCKEINTFIFPWGEATVTLEDVMILGGFSALGEPVRVLEPLGGVLGHMVSKMTQEMRDVRKNNCNRADQLSWMKHYMGACKGDEIEHIAFLSLWLSRFVLVSSERLIAKSVFQVAVRLASGMRIALAPAVLASIYRGLQVVKDGICTNSSSTIATWAPFNIVQTWLWERFPALRPGSRSLEVDMPRAARWMLTGKPIDLSFAMQILVSPDEFRWRPYAVELDNWRKPSFYMNDGRWFHSNGTQDDELRAFACCLRASELVGLDCIEQYHPQRVAMQFGLDQDIPKFVPRANSTWEEAWKTYDISSNNVIFYVPLQLFKSGFTVEYSNWLGYIQTKEMVAVKKRKKALPLPYSKKKIVKGVIGTKCSRRFALGYLEIGSKDNCCKSQKRKIDMRTQLTQPLKSSETMSQNFDDAREYKLASETYKEDELGLDLLDVSEDGIGYLEIGNKDDCCKSQKRKNDASTQLTQPLKSSETMSQNFDDTREYKLASETYKEDELGLDLLDVSEDGIIKDVKETNAGHLHCEPIVIERSKVENEKLDDESWPESLHVYEGVVICSFKTVAEEFEFERTMLRKHEAKSYTEEEREWTRKKELESDMKIKRLKEEISSLLAKIKYLESLLESQSKSELISSPP